VVVLPSNIRTTIAGIDRYGEPVDEAYAPMSVAIRLRDDVDVGRGEVIASAETPAESLARDHGTPVLDGGTASRAAHAAACATGDRLRSRHRHRHRITGRHPQLSRTCPDRRNSP